MTHKLPIFDGFDCNGNPTGHKCMICLKQEEDCKHQGFYGEGAFLICKKYNENNKFKCELNELTMTQEQIIKAASEHYIEQINKEFTPWVTDSTGLGMPIHMASFGAKYALDHPWTKTKDEIPTDKRILAKLDPKFTGGLEGHYEVLHWIDGWDISHQSGYYDQSGENIPIDAITHWMRIPNVDD